MKRAASLAEHLLHDFHQELPGGITLIPSSGGVFEVTLGDELVYSKKRLGRFPEEHEVESTLAPLLGVEWRTEG